MVVSSVMNSILVKFSLKLEKYELHSPLFSFDETAHIDILSVEIFDTGTKSLSMSNDTNDML